MNYDNGKVIMRLVLDMEILQEQQDEEHGETANQSHKHAALALQHLWHKLDAALNKLASLENQSQWKCACGGTDCDGERENAALRAENDALIENVRGLEPMVDRLERENAELKQAFADAEVLYEYKRTDGWREWALVHTLIRSGDVIVMMDRVAFEAARAKEAKP